MNSNLATVEELIGIKEFSKHATLVTKNSDCSRIVSHVTIMEAPDLNEWVTGGEFVLTTWYSLSKDSKLAEESFKKLAPKIAAIGIKTHRFINKIPDDILKIAEQFRLPVFEIQRDTLFRNLVKIIATRIQNYQLNMLYEAEFFHKELVEASAYTDDIQKILNLLSDNIKQPCALLNNDLRIVAQRGRLVTNQNIKIIREFISRVYMTTSPFFYTKVFDEIGFFPCLIRQKIVGFILVPKEVLKSERYLLACQQSSAFLSIRLWSIYEDLHKRKLFFLQKFTSSESINKDYLALKMRKLGVEATKNMTVTLIYTEGSPINLYSYLEFNINQKVIYQDNDDILLIFNGNNFVEKLDNIIKIMNNKKTNYVIVGSEPTNDIDVLREYYKLALNCMNVCKKTSLWGIWKMNDFPLHSILLDIKETSHYKYIKTNVLFPIIDFDKEYNAELLKSLYMYNNLGSISKAAKYLQIHVNTLRYRLEKIYDITGLDMNIPKDNIQLAFAVAIADLENITDSDWKKCYTASGSGSRQIERGCSPS